MSRPGKKEAAKADVWPEGALGPWPPESRQAAERAAVGILNRLANLVGVSDPGNRRSDFFEQRLADVLVRWRLLDTPWLREIFDALPPETRRSVDAEIARVRGGIQ
jgi:hypothetical protein